MGNQWDFSLCSRNAKATNEVHADFDGFVYHTAQSGQRLRGRDRAAQFDEVGDVDQIDALIQQEDAGKPKVEKKATKKAEIIIKRNHLALDDVQMHFGPNAGTITEEMVNMYLDARSKFDFRRGFNALERVGVIGGVGGGGALIVLDSLLRSQTQNPVAVFDQNVEFHGKAILGIPVVGDVDVIWGWMAEGRLDSVVIAFNRDLRERKRVFDELRCKAPVFAMWWTVLPIFDRT